jgi:hypothetical protein
MMERFAGIRPKVKPNRHQVVVRYGQEVGAMSIIEKDRAIVEIRSGKLIVFDLPYEGVLYHVPDFSPGLYSIPLSAIRKAPEDLQDEAKVYVDTGTMFFVDADFRQRLSEIEQRLWDETGDSYEILNRYEQVVAELGARFDFFSAPGIDTGFDFEGDGAYVLDLSKVERLLEGA